MTFKIKSYMRNTKVFKLKLKSYQCIIGGDNWLGEAEKQGAFMKHFKTKSKIWQFANGFIPPLILIILLDLPANLNLQHLKFHAVSVSHFYTWCSAFLWILVKAFIISCLGDFFWAQCFTAGGRFGSPDDSLGQGVSHLMNVRHLAESARILRGRDRESSSTADEGGAGPWHPLPLPWCWWFRCVSQEIDLKLKRKEKFHRIWCATWSLRYYLLIVCSYYSFFSFYSSVESKNEQTNGVLLVLPEVGGDSQGSDGAIAPVKPEVQ